MMADEQAREGDAERGVFGNLPGTRPGVRSPRRDAGKSAAGPRKVTPRRSSTRPRAVPRAKPAAPRPSAAPRRPTPDEAPPAEPGGDEEAPGRGAGVEELAWAGITVAAEAATLGVRLLGRAVDVVRRPTNRR